MSIAQTIKSAGKQGAHRPFGSADLIGQPDYAQTVFMQAEAIGREFDSESIEQGEI